MADGFHIEKTPPGTIAVAMSSYTDEPMHELLAFWRTVFRDRPPFIAYSAEGVFLGLGDMNGKDSILLSARPSDG